jgi:hypothetical protein
MVAQDYLLFRNQTALMQSVQRRIKCCPLYTQGTLSSNKITAFVDKMHERYHVLLTDQERHVLRKAGFPATFLAVHPSLEHNDCFYWLLFSSGLLQGEVLRGARDVQSRLLWRHYVLTENRYKRWTWRLRREYRQEYEQRLLEAAKRRDTVRMNVLLEGLAKMPMFNGVREDVKDLVRRTQLAWGESRNAPKPHFFRRQPNWPKSYPVMRRVVFHGDPPVTLGQYLMSVQDT